MIIYRAALISVSLDLSQTTTLIDHCPRIWG